MLHYLIKVMAFFFIVREGRQALLISLAVVMVMVLFWNLGPQPFKMSPLQIRIGNELVEKAVARFPWSSQVGSVMMVSEVEDWAPFFQNAIRSRVEDFNSDGSRKFDILPDPFVARVTKSLGFKNVRGVLSDAQIKEIVREMKADTLLLLRFAISDYTEDEVIAKGKLSCVFYGKNDSAPIRIDVLAEQTKSIGLIERVSLYFRAMSKIHRIVWGVLGVLLFPFLAAPLTMTVVRMRSAKANGIMIFVYAIIIFATEGIMFSAPSNLFEGLVACVWGVIIVWYLLKMCDLIASPGFKRRMQVFKRK